jgi:hypothetical protein
MAEMGSFKVAGKVLVRESDLLAWEERSASASRRDASTASTPGVSPSGAPRRRRRPPTSSSEYEHAALPPGWHKQAPSQPRDPRGTT